MVVDPKPPKLGAAVDGGAPENPKEFACGAPNVEGVPNVDAPPPNKLGAVVVAGGAVPKAPVPPNKLGFEVAVAAVCVPKPPKPPPKFGAAEGGADPKAGAAPKAGVG